MLRFKPKVLPSRRELLEAQTAERLVVADEELDGMEEVTLEAVIEVEEEAVVEEEGLGSEHTS